MTQSVIASTLCCLGWSDRRRVGQAASVTEHACRGRIILLRQERRGIGQYDNLHSVLTDRGTFELDRFIAHLADALWQLATAVLPTLGVLRIKSLSGNATTIAALRKADMDVRPHARIHLPALAAGTPGEVQARLQCGCQSKLAEFTPRAAEQ